MRLRDAAEKAGIPYRTAARWVSQGVVIADGGGASGRPYKIGPKHVRELSILAELRSALSLQQLREAARFLRKLGHNPFSKGRFAVVGGPAGKRELVKITDEGQAIKLLRQPGQTLLIPLQDPMGE